MANVSYSVSIESLVLITVDRFIATVFPIKVSIITKKIRMAGILLSWIIPMGILAPFLHFTNKALDTDGPFICTMGSKMLNVLYTVMGFVLLYVIPLAIIIILNTQIKQISIKYMNIIFISRINSFFILNFLTISLL